MPERKCKDSVLSMAPKVRQLHGEVPRIDDFKAMTAVSKLESRWVPDAPRHALGTKQADPWFWFLKQESLEGEHGTAAPVP